MGKVTLRDVLVWICVVLLPPLGLFLAKGVIDKDFWINLLLTLIAYIPGLIHAVYVVSKIGTGGSSSVAPASELDQPILETSAA